MFNTTLELEASKIFFQWFSAVSTRYACYACQTAGLLIVEYAIAHLINLHTSVLVHTRAQYTRRHAAFCRAAAVTCREALQMCGRCAARHNIGIRSVKDLFSIVSFPPVSTRYACCMHAGHKLLVYLLNYNEYAIAHLINLHTSVLVHSSG